MKNTHKRTFLKEEIDDVAGELLARLRASVEDGGGKAGATVVALSGDLGAGKTTLAQSVARQLGVAESVISPTFVIMKSYALPRAACARGFSRLVHIDAYRLDSAAELERLGWKELLADPDNLILIEWPERVIESIPESARKVSLSHVDLEIREMEL